MSRLITLDLRESLAMRRLRRHIRVKNAESFYEHPCDICGGQVMWNPEIFPVNEPHGCERCAPDEHWWTGVDRAIADRLFNEHEAEKKRLSV